MTERPMRFGRYLVVLAVAFAVCVGIGWLISLAHLPWWLFLPLGAVVAVAVGWAAVTLTDQWVWPIPEADEWTEDQLP